MTRLPQVTPQISSTNFSQTHSWAVQSWGDQNCRSYYSWTRLLEQCCHIVNKVHSFMNNLISFEHYHELQYFYEVSWTSYELLMNFLHTGVTLASFMFSTIYSWCLDSSAVQEIEIVVNIWGLGLGGWVGWGGIPCVWFLRPAFPSVGNPLTGKGLRNRHHTTRSEAWSFQREYEVLILSQLLRVK